MGLIKMNKSLSHVLGHKMINFFKCLMPVRANENVEVLFFYFYVHYCFVFQNILNKRINFKSMKSQQAGRITEM